MRFRKRRVKVKSPQQCAACKGEIPAGASVTRFFLKQDGRRSEYFYVHRKLECNEKNHP